MSDKKRETFISKLKGKEKEEFYRKQRLAIQERKEARLKLHKEAEKKAKEILPEILAAKIIEETHGENFRPTMDTVVKLRSLVGKGMSLNDIRKRYFSSVSQAHWDKVTRWMFKDTVPNAEALGIDIFKTQLNYKKQLKKRIRDLKREIRSYKLSEKAVPTKLHMLIAEAEEKIYRIEMDVADSLKNLEVVGDKARNTAINIHMATPRPKKKEDDDDNEIIEVKDVERVSLSDLTGD